MVLWVFCWEAAQCLEADVEFLWMMCKLAVYRVALTNWPHLNEMCFNMAKCKMRNKRVNNRLWEEYLGVQLSK